jgi:hypothetical protein
MIHDQGLVDQLSALPVEPCEGEVVLTDGVSPAGVLFLF